MGTTTVIKVNSLGSDMQDEKIKRVKELSVEISKELDIFCSVYDDELICNVEDKGKISDYLLMRDIDHK